MVGGFTALVVRVLDKLAAKKRKQQTTNINTEEDLATLLRKQRTSNRLEIDKDLQSLHEIQSVVRAQVGSLRAVATDKSKKS